MMPLERLDRLANASQSVGSASGRLRAAVQHRRVYSSAFILKTRFLSGAESGALVEIITVLSIQSLGLAGGGITVEEKRLRRASACGTGSDGSMHHAFKCFLKTTNNQQDPRCFVCLF